MFFDQIEAARAVRERDEYKHEVEVGVPANWMEEECL